MLPVTWTLSYRQVLFSGRKIKGKGGCRTFSPFYYCWLAASSHTLRKGLMSSRTAGDRLERVRELAGNKTSLAEPGKEMPGSEQQLGHCEPGLSICLGARSCPLKEKFPESLGAETKSRNFFFPSWRSQGLPGEAGVIKAMQKDLGAERRN